MSAPSSRDTLKQGSIDPYHIRFDISNLETDASDVDFTDVISAVFSVRLPDGVTLVTWPAQIESVSPTLIRIAYAFLINDLDQLGEFQVVPELTLSTGGILFAAERRFTVIPEFKET